MPRYRFLLPVRAIGGYRLPDAGVVVEDIALSAGVDPAYTARVDNVQAEHAEAAYRLAQDLADYLLSYLALLGEDAAFVIDGREGLRARNIDLEENPIPTDQPAPRFESIGGVITAAGQGPMAQLLDPDGSKRRTGAVLVHNARGVLVPSQDRLAELCTLFQSRATAPARLQIALGIIHDAACAKEFANGFAQSYTALEVMTEHLKPPSVLDGFYQESIEQNTVGDLPYQTKAAFLVALRAFVEASAIPASQAERISSYVSMTQSVSQVDVFRDYLASLGIDVDRKEVMSWRSMRGALVHASEANEGQHASMRRFRELVRNAVLEELRRTAAPAYQGG
jgi:hypothetical protein